MQDFLPASFSPIKKAGRFFFQFHPGSNGLYGAPFPDTCDC